MPPEELRQFGPKQVWIDWSVMPRLVACAALILLSVTACSPGDPGGQPATAPAHVAGSDPALERRIEDYLRPWIDRYVPGVPHHGARAASLLYSRQS